MSRGWAYILAEAWFITSLIHLRIFAILTATIFFVKIKMVLSPISNGILSTIIIDSIRIVWYTLRDGFLSGEQQWQMKRV